MSSTKNWTNRAKSLMALTFIKAAGRFFISARDYEVNNEKANDDYNSFIIGSIISAVSYLECQINEIFSDITTNNFVELEYNLIEVNRVEILQKLWRQGIPRTARYSILDKYNVFLDICGLQPFSKGINPYQDVVILIEMRNELVHNESEWVYYDKNESEIISKPHTFESKVNGRFTLSPYHTSGPIFFPDRCLSSDCARWAIKSSMNFVDLFFGKIGANNICKEVEWLNSL